MRLRDRKHTAFELKKQDPKTAVTYDLIRKSVLTGVLPYFQVGRKKLVDIDSLEQQLFLKKAADRELGGDLS